MTVEIIPGKAAGTVAAPSSKSMAHRLLICAGLSQGVSTVRGIDMNEDVAATIDCLRALGAECDLSGDTVTLRGIDPRKSRPQSVLCCRESGSTLRFFIPLALLCGETVAFTGTEKLLSRPLEVYETLCAQRGFDFCRQGGQLLVKGKPTAGVYTIPGDISSQFITGLLFALPLAAEDSTVSITPPVESRSYVNLTLQALHAFGIRAEWLDDHTIAIPGNQQYQPREMTVEGDYSGAAFFAALSTLGGDIAITGLDPDSLQGDKVYETHLESLKRGCPEIDLTDCPDLGPVLFAVAAAKNGAVFTGTRRLKIKESDRAEAMARELSKFGAKVTVEENRVTVAAGLNPPTQVLQGHNDHRIVMSLAVLLTLTGGKIEGAQAVRKSFPDFFQRLEALGIEVIAHETDK